MFNLLAFLILNIPTSPIQPSFTLTSNACAGLDVDESAFDEGGICFYSLGEEGWYYIKNNKVHGNPCTLDDKDNWCKGFATKEDAIKASKYN